MAQHAEQARVLVGMCHDLATQLQELCQYVQDTSPVRDSLANAVPVETTLEVV